MKVKVGLLFYPQSTSTFVKSIEERCFLLKFSFHRLLYQEFALKRVCECLVLSASLLMLSAATDFASALEEGDRGSEVEELQENLRFLGFFPEELEPTGFYGSLTVSSVNAFQRTESILDADGIAGEDTLRILQSSVDRLRGTNTTIENRRPGRIRELLGDELSQQTVNNLIARIEYDLRALQRELRDEGLYYGDIDGIYGPRTETAVLAYAFRELLPGGVAGANEVLELGSRGPLVERLQEQLRVRGYYFGPIDGEFGPYTEAAVINFQRDESLDADGRAGQDTNEKLGELRPRQRY